MYDKRSNNLCNTYILPLVGCNKLSFGDSNFINSYLAEDNIHVVVQVNNIVNSMLRHVCYKFDFRRDECQYAVYQIPKPLQDTVKLFREGKYSQFSLLAKEAIRTKSGLRWKVANPINQKEVISARELLALDKDKALKKTLEEELQVKIDADAELASIPGEENFFALNLNQVETVS